MKKEKYLDSENLIIVCRQILDHVSNQINIKKIKFKTNSSALIILDMQQYFSSINSKAFLPSIPSIIPRINKLIDYFHLNNLIVIFTKHIDKLNENNMMLKWWKGYIDKDNPLSQLDNNLNTNNSIIIEKNTYDAFYNTDLENILKSNSIKQIIITGVVTHLCVETTIRNAFIRNYEVILPIDCTADYNYQISLNSILNLGHGFCHITLSDNLFI